MRKLFSHFTILENLFAGTRKFFLLSLPSPHQFLRSLIFFVILCFRLQRQVFRFSCLRNVTFISFAFISFSHYHHLFFIIRPRNKESDRENTITTRGLRLDIDNDINVKIINVIAGLFDSWRSLQKENWQNWKGKMRKKRKEKLRSRVCFCKRCCKLADFSTFMNQEISLSFVIYLLLA